MTDLSQINSNSIKSKQPKSKEDYSRNVKKLKIKLANVQQEIEKIEKKIKSFSNTSNDKMIALKISKFCRQRRMTPEMLFRCSDRQRRNNVPKSTFKQTIIALGMSNSSTKIELTQYELTRLQYLLDEDISGEISLEEYMMYLVAFGIKGEYSADEIILKKMIDKINAKKLLDSVQDRDADKKYKQVSGHITQLINYEQFLKYCHRNLPQLKDKEIAALFNLLQKNDLIDLDEFIDYIKKREYQKQNADKKNKNVSESQLRLINEDEGNSLKGILKLIIKNRPKDSKPLFHAIEFSKVEKILNKKKGDLLQIFKQIDKKKRGSFSFMQLIQFYIEKQKERDLIYVYELMGRKMLIDKQYPQDVICRECGGPGNKKINLEQFQSFMRKEFGVVASDAEATFRALSGQENQLTIKRILDAMQLQRGQKQLVYIKPNVWKTQFCDYWKKGCYTVLFNPFVALRFCLQISEQMSKIGHTYWDDFQFGPTFEDPYGVDSIGFESIQQSQVRWLTVEQLKMRQFYNVTGWQYQCSLNCLNETFMKTFSALINSSQNFLWNKQRIDYNTKNIQQIHLKYLFQGVYPLVFHQFALVGIYVFRFFVRDKWVYVLVDNKIPCNAQNNPLFSFAKGMRNSWVSLIEKAYAKLKGNYHKLFLVNSVQQYIYELSRKLPIISQIPSQQLQTDEQKNRLWRHMLELKALKKSNKQQNIFGLVTDAIALDQNKQHTGILKDKPNQIDSLMQIEDEDVDNTHKSHRLVLLKGLQLKNEKVWNPNWCISQNNKYSKFVDSIDAQIKTKSNVVDLFQISNIVTILNFKLFRSIFNQLMYCKLPQFDKMIILRKVAQFQKKFTCRYELRSKDKGKKPIGMIITLNRLMSPDDALIELRVKDHQGKQVQKKQSNKSFSVFEFKIGAQGNHCLEIGVGNWCDGKNYAYTLTFYMQNPLYHMKELDRQILFSYLGPYEQKYYLDINEADEQQKKYIYRNFYKAAQRRGCCG